MSVVTTLLGKVQTLWKEQTRYPKVGCTYTLQEIRAMPDLDKIGFHFEHNGRYMCVDYYQRQVFNLMQLCGGDSRWEYRNESWSEGYEFHKVS
jgi:hypothetical protein